MPRHGSAAPGAEVDLGPVPSRGRSLAGWSIRRKLMLLVMIPLIALLAGGGVLITQIALDYREAHTARVYGDAVPALLTAAVALNNELNAVDPRDSAALNQARGDSDRAVSGAKQALADLREADADNALAPDADQVSNALDSLPNTRGRVDRLRDNNAIATTSGRAQLRDVTRPVFDAMEALTTRVAGELAQNTTNEDAADDARLVAALTRAANAAGSEAITLGTVLGTPSEMNLARLQELSDLAAAQRQGLADAEATATAEQKASLQTIGGYDEALERWREQAVGLLGTSDRAASEQTLKDAQRWGTFAATRVQDMATLGTTAAGDMRSDIRDTETAALWRLGLFALAVILTLAVVMGLLAMIARSVTVPLRRLRSGAVDVASVQLPAAVARIEQDGTATDISLPPVLPADSAAGPETIEVARAVDDLGAEAVRLATAQVRLRRALDEAFVSMSRRSQAMVEKQLGIIDELESQEQDPDQLRNLFRLDHLAARMRRYNDNLLVLAGSAVRTRATAPVKVAELFRAATSEMEQYERVRLQPVSGASVSGTVAGELVHLLAELLDNAAMYSPPSSAIVLSAAFTADGGLQIEVLDAGVGIAPGELDRLNARLAQPESIDTQVPSRMGLFVVARLARRGGFGVMLQARPDAAGTVAMVRIPPTLVIGAPGSTGETPQAASQFGGIRPLTPAAGLPAATPPPAVAAAAFEPQPDGLLSPAAAAANVRSVVDDEGSGASPLPRRRKQPPHTSAPPGLPPAAIAAQSTLTPPGGLFTPTVPVEPREEQQSEQAGQEAARAKDYDDLSDYRDPGGPLGVPDGPEYGASDRGGADFGAADFGAAALGVPEFASPEFGGPRQTVADTSPNGVPITGISQPAGETVTPDAGLPRRTRPSGAYPYTGNPPSGASPYTGVNPATGEPMGPIRARATGSSGELPEAPATSGMPLNGISTTTGSSSASALPLVPPTADTPPRGVPVGRGGEDPSGQPLTAPSGQPKNRPEDHNRTVPEGEGSGAAPAAWDDQLPTELAARAAAQHSYVPADPDAPMIGDDVLPDWNDPTPIFDQISVWFSTDPVTGGVPVQAVQSVEDGEEVIDLRERQPSSRWQSLGDQRWLATNARASAAPESEGTTEQGLPKRRPGANLLPSAAGVAPPPAAHRGGPVPPEIPRAPYAGADADLVRGRLGSYQRGLATARRARQEQQQPVEETDAGFDPVAAGLFTANREPGDDAGRNEQGGDQ